jgi:hypothetical protein
MPIELWRAPSEDQERFRRLYELYSCAFRGIYQPDVTISAHYLQSHNLTVFDFAVNSGLVPIS